ncbi:hypothetical protein SHELI_v1c03080 [Spiroplasma helicoides]|uniref:Uncharacterized protein n=1 Tax=Spiroplasma helicoides TaxID=216938 RepID=A0A1B3SK01_9MOLU|nr:hypothetical protein [Spiroplasma helicoides]AOG60263.1 hypothetical protein SHELI_v1c03080 [Spiroplasma helicoides]
MKSEDKKKKVVNVKIGNNVLVNNIDENIEDAVKTIVKNMDEHINDAVMKSILKDDE